MQGRLEREGEVTQLIAGRLTDYSAQLGSRSLFAGLSLRKEFFQREEPARGRGTRKRKMSSGFKRGMPMTQTEAGIAHGALILNGQGITLAG